MFALRNRDAEERQGVIRIDGDSELASERDKSSCTQNVCFEQQISILVVYLTANVSHQGIHRLTPKLLWFECKHCILYLYYAIFFFVLAVLCIFSGADAVNVVVQLSYAYHQTVRITIWGNNKIIKY